MPVDQLPHSITQEKFKAGESERRNTRYKNKKTSGIGTLQCNYE